MGNESFGQEIDRNQEKEYRDDVDIVIESIGRIGSRRWRKDISSSIMRVKSHQPSK